MPASNEHPTDRPAIRRTCLGYAVGCAIAWAIVWTILALTASEETKRKALLGFQGWVVGWSSASIARIVYTPPKPRGSVSP
ncbi:MAG TPA: hypothetical protein VEF89_24510 [Solirubrobacteraceae bacterium]|nr:hypothetical protein [Solirubrobacteraceae bacterium]